MLRVFCGYDQREAIAFDVLSRSIQDRATCPVSIARIDVRQLPYYNRKADPKASTAFTYARFLVPWICNYQGRAVFMDCDMLCLDDIEQLRNFPRAGHAVSVVKHDYQPKAGTKFLGALQEPYPKKLWSSLMVFDNDKCRALTPDYVNRSTGQQLHQFQWLREEQIGSLPMEWNYVPGHSTGSPKMVHFTTGGPWFPDYSDCLMADTWKAEAAKLSSWSK